MSDTDMADATTWWLGHIAGPLINSNIVAKFNALRARLGGVGPMASGAVTITPSAANTLTTVSVSLPAGRFASAPLILASIGAAGPNGTTTCFVWGSGATTTAFSLNILRSTTTPTTVNWLAVLTS